MRIGNNNLIITNEHGSWVVLLVPMLTGIVSTKIVSSDLLPLFFLVLFSFLLYRPSEIMLHEWIVNRKINKKFQVALTSFIVYAIFVTGFLVYEIFFLQKNFLLLFGVAAVIIFVLSVKLKSSGKLSFLREFLGVIILTSTAPIAIYCLSNKITDSAVTLWILNSLFFFSGTCYVNYLIEKLADSKGKNRSPEKISSKNIHFVYHLALSFFLVLFLVVFPDQYLKAIAFIPMLFLAFNVYFSGQVVKDFKKVGLTLLGHSLFFALFISLR